MGSSLVGRRVLVVDDDDDGRDLLRTVLEQRGAVVAVADGALAALSEIERERPDIVVSDIAMPDEDGHGLVKKLRAMPAPTSTIPAIAVTAYAGAADRRRALDAGFDAYVAKPVDFDALFQAIEDACALRR